MGEIGLHAIYDSIHLPYNFKTFQQFVDTNNHDYQFIMYDSREPNKKDRIKIVKAKEFNNLKLQK